MDKWLRVLNAVAGVATAARRLRGGDEPRTDLAGPGALGQLEARLAGVVVAALKEAFDRDRARMDLERARVEAEHQRAEEALRLERLRQAGERALVQGRMTVILSVAVWTVSTLLLFLLPALRAPLPRTLLGLGWASLIGALAVAFAAHTAVTAWMSGTDGARGAEAVAPAGTAASWLLVAGLTLTAASLLVAL